MLAAQIELSPRAADEHGPAIGADQKGHGNGGAMGGEEAGRAVLAVDHLVVGAAAIKLMFAFAQTVHQRVGMKTHRAIGDIRESQFLEKAVVGAMDGNGQRLRLDGEAHFAGLDVLGAGDVASAEFFGDGKRDKRGGGWNGAGLSLLIERGDDQLRRAVADLGEGNFAVGAGPEDGGIGVGAGGE